MQLNLVSLGHMVIFALNRDNYVLQVTQDANLQVCVKALRKGFFTWIFIHIGQFFQRINPNPNSVRMPEVARLISQCDNVPADFRQALDYKIGQYERKKQCRLLDPHSEVYQIQDLSLEIQNGIDRSEVKFADIVFRNIDQVGRRNFSRIVSAESVIRDQNGPVSRTFDLEISPLLQRENGNINSKAVIDGIILGQNNDCATEIKKIEQIYSRIMLTIVKQGNDALKVTMSARI